MKVDEAKFYTTDITRRKYSFIQYFFTKPLHFAYANHIVKIASFLKTAFIYGCKTEEFQIRSFQNSNAL